MNHSHFYCLNFDNYVIICKSENSFPSFDLNDLKNDPRNYAISQNPVKSLLCDYCVQPFLFFVSSDQ